MLSWDPIERGLQRCLELVRADRRMLAEFHQSRAEFFEDPAAALAPLAELRHLEWFLLERPSPALGAIPAQAWQAEWLAAVPGAASELNASLLHSMPGAYEVTSLVPGEGLWVRDLFTLGEHPVAEAHAIASLEVGDLLVGRIFPAGGGTFLLSPAVSVFRNPALAGAVRADLEAMRAVRRGVLRVQQLELERLFHGSESHPILPQQIAEARTRTRTELQRLGLDARLVAEVLERVQSAAASSRGEVITEILNNLAFETSVDLSPVRLLLVELWDRERGLHVEGAAPTVEEHADDDEDGAHAALEAFDRGRAQGKDLEQLFRDLERDLGLADEEVEEEDSEESEQGAPELPGLIAALVEEFLWEVAREQGPERARAWEVLRALGNYGRDIGILEELGHARLLDFSTRWLLDESGLAFAEVETLMDALTAFCQWCEEHHDLPLWRQFGATLSSLRASVPRHLLLRQENGANAGSGSYVVVRVGEAEAVVSDGRGREQDIAITPHQATHLREGDLVRLKKGPPALGASYPGELAALSPS